MSNKAEPNKKKIEQVIFLFNQRNYSEALNCATKILDDYPNSILINNITGVIHTELNNYNSAKKLFIKVVNLNPKYNDGNYNLANIYSKLGEEEKALEAYEKVQQYIIPKGFHEYKKLFEELIES